MNNYRQEIDKLIGYLAAAKIPFELHKCWDGWQVAIEEIGVDALCHGHSYGHEQGLLEIMGGLTKEESEWDVIVGWLNAEEVAKRFIWCWEHQTDIYEKQEEKVNGRI